jgi:hypothetical protein
MEKRNLAEWAAVSEIIGTLAVVISLLFVGFNINKNTRVMHAANDNLLYEMQDAILNSVVESSDFASIYQRHLNEGELTPVEELRMLIHGLRDLFMWELTYVRYQEGLFSSDQWNAWNKSYSIQFKSEFPNEWWEDSRDWVRDDFEAHVDAVYASADD